MKLRELGRLLTTEGLTLRVWGDKTWFYAMLVEAGGHADYEGRGDTLQDAIYDVLARRSRYYKRLEVPCEEA